MLVFWDVLVSWDEFVFWDAMFFCNNFMLPKRRFWKAEQTFRNEFSNHFSNERSKNRVLTYVKSALKIRLLGLPKCSFGEQQNIVACVGFLGRVGFCGMCLFSGMLCSFVTSLCSPNEDFGQLYTPQTKILDG